MHRYCVKDNMTCLLNYVAEVIANFKKNLKRLHQQSLQRLDHAKPLIHDPSKYTKLRIYKDHTVFKEFESTKEVETYLGAKRPGYRSARRPGYRGFTYWDVDLEFRYASNIRGNEDIGLDELFSAKSGDEEPRTVILLGVPGSGKTLTFHHLLQEIINERMYRDQDFVFAVTLRTINVSGPKSFRSFILSNPGPAAASKDDEDIIWKHLLQHERKTTILLDGFDEVQGLGTKYDESNTDALPNLEEERKQQNLLYNLISGNVFPNTRVLVTSRPHCATWLYEQAHNPRLVHLDFLDEQQVKEFIFTELQRRCILSKSLFKYMKSRPNVLDFCKVPLHCRNLVRYVSRLHKGPHDTKLNKRKMPKSISALYFILDIAMLKAADRSIQEQDDITILKKKGSFLSKVAQLASNGMLDGEVKQLFTEEDLKKAGLSEDEVEGSILTCTEALVTEGQITGEPVPKRFFMFSHYTEQEHLTGIQLNKVCLHIYLHT